MKQQQRERDYNFNIRIYPKVKERIKSITWIKGGDPSLFRELIRDVVARPGKYPLPTSKDHKDMGEDGVLTITIDDNTKEELDREARTLYMNTKGFASLCLFRAWLRLRKEDPERVVKTENGLIFERQENSLIP